MVALFSTCCCVNFAFNCAQQVSYFNILTLGMRLRMFALFYTYYCVNFLRFLIILFASKLLSYLGNILCDKNECQVCDWGISAPPVQYRIVRAGGCGSVAEHWLHKPDFLGLIPCDCQPFHFVYTQTVLKLWYYHNTCYGIKCGCSLISPLVFVHSLFSVFIQIVVL